eukprot:jgi/Chrzof1/4051/Cz13g18160.t1
MAALKGLMAGAAGAAAYNVYRDSDSVFSSRDIASGLYDAFQKKGAVNITEMTRMQKQIEDLQGALLKSFHERQQSPIIIHSGSKAGASTTAGVFVVIGGVLVYLRFVKGYKLTDLMYVTKSSLNNLKQSMSEGIQRMNEQIKATTDDLLDRLGLVTAKQDDLMDQQQEMDATLKRVEDNVEQVHGNIHLLSDQVAYSNQAITLLCGAIAEVAKRCGINNGRYTRALDSLTRNAPVLPGTSAAAVHVIESSHIKPMQGIESLTDIAEVTLERAATAPMPPAGTSGMGRSLQQSVPNPAIYALPIIPSTSSSSTTTSPKPYSRGRAQSDNVASINPANEFRQLMQESRQRANSAVDDSSSSIADVSKPSSSGWFSRR